MTVEDVYSFPHMRGKFTLWNNKKKTVVEFPPYAGEVYRGDS